MPGRRKFTDEQLLDALRQTGTQRGAAEILGTSQSAISPRLNALIRQGMASEFDWRTPLPGGHKVRGVSTYYDADGKVRGQWVKTSEDETRRREWIEAACRAAIEPLPRVGKTALVQRGHRADLLAAYPIGDPHFGMRAWAEECGQDWDLSIAERAHCNAMDALVASAPLAEQALIVNLGDLFHYDSLAPVTPRSGHMLDADGRYAKMIAVGVKVIRQCISSALAKHRRVHVINAIGNHDETGAIWLSMSLAHIYEGEPRVTIETSPALFSYYRFGRCLIGVHHGHTCKPEKLPGVMAADRARDWGETEHRYWWMGHVHHESKREFPGVSVESFGTLAVRDAYATSGGWRSRECMQSIILHRDYGEVARSRVSLGMVMEGAK